MKNIKISGGCVSRDIFNFDINNEIQLISYNARSSLATLGLENTSISIPNNYYGSLESIESAFQRRMVQSDFNNELLSSVISNGYDVLLIDLLVERFHLVEIGGKLVTNSSEFQRSTIRPDRIVDSFSDEFADLWRKGVDNLFNIIDSTVGLSVIRINKVYWTDTSVDSDHTLVLRKKWKIEKNNEKLHSMYEYIENILPKTSIIEVPKELLIADPEHKFGFSPFHYTDTYYKEVLKLIN